MSNQERNSLFVIGRTLRKFGLVDVFGLGEVVESGRYLSRAKIERLITDSDVLLPAGLSAKFLSEHLAADLNIGSHDADQELATQLTSLASIPAGRPSAGRYHTAILKILRLLFESRLGMITKEKQIMSGTKRVDLKADNDQREGFFAALRQRRDFFCPYVFIECKNYAGDLKNPEVDQLLGRLTPKTTQFGMIVCRQVQDERKVLKRLQSPFLSEGKVVLLVVDKTLSDLAQARINYGLTAFDQRLHKEFEKVAL